MLRTYGRRTFDFARRTAVMAILNRTPDSFYDHGATYGFGAALEAGERALAEGADWLGVGGGKGGPGPPGGGGEEVGRGGALGGGAGAGAAAGRGPARPHRRGAVGRHLPARGGPPGPGRRGRRGQRPLGPARPAGGRGGRRGRGRPCADASPRRPPRAAVLAEARASLPARAALPRPRGVPAERLIVDPGHDFHKNTFHSLELTRRLGELADLGHPLPVALPNKAFGGEALAVPLDQRLEGSLAAAAFSVVAGASILRVHEV